MAISSSAYKWRDVSSERTGEQMLRSVQQMLETHLPYMVGQSIRVEKVCRIIGEILGLPQETMFALTIVARYHELGLLSVPTEILLKPSGLSPKEIARVNQHSDVGGRLVAKCYPDFPEIAEGIWFHHEWYDGTGPHGLKGENIPVIARIVHFVSAAEAMANPRPFRDAFPLYKFIMELKVKSGIQFDPNLVPIIESESEGFYQILSATAPIQATSKTTVPNFINKNQTCDTGRTMMKLTTPNPEKPTAQRKILSNASISSSKVAPAGSSTPIKKFDIDKITPVMSPAKLLNLLKEGMELKSFSGNIQNVMAVTQNPLCSVEDVAREVMLDQVLSVRVLKLANSSAYTAGKPTNNLRAAIGRIGVREVRNLVMTLGIIDHFKGTLSTKIVPQHFWEHSIACGLVATSLAKACKLKGVDDLFLSGVIHDVGRLILLVKLPDQYMNILDMAEQSGLPLEVVEKKVLSLDHCDVLQNALTLWNFPKEFITPVIQHHKPLPILQRLAPAYITTAVILSLANKLTHAMLLGNSGDIMIHPYDDLFKALNVNPDVIDRIKSTIPDETASLRLSLIIRTSNDNIENYNTLIKNQIENPIAVLGVTLQNELDSFRLLLDQISTPGRTPNLGLIYIRNESQIKELLQKYEREEQQAHCGVLPILFFAPTENITLPTQWNESRRLTILKFPTSIQNIIQTINATHINPLN